MFDQVSTLFDTLSQFLTENRDLLTTVGLTSIPGTVFWLLFLVLTRLRGKKNLPPAAEPLVLHPSDLALKLKSYLQDLNKDWKMGTFSIWVEKEFTFIVSDKILGSVYFKGDKIHLTPSDEKFLFPYARQTKDYLTAKQDQNAAITSLVALEEKESAMEEVLSPPTSQPSVVVQTVVETHIPSELTLKLRKLLDEDSSPWIYQGTIRDGGHQVRKIKCGTVEIWAIANHKSENHSLIKLLQENKDCTSMVPMRDLELLDVSVSNRLKKIMEEENRKSREEQKSLQASLLQEVEKILHLPVVLKVDPLKLNTTNLPKQMAYHPNPTNIDNQVRFVPYPEVHFNGKDYTLFSGKPTVRNYTYYGTVNGKETPLVSFLGSLYYEKELQA